MPCHKTLLQIRSILLRTHHGNSLMDIINIGMVVSTELINTVIPPSERYSPFQPSSFLLRLSRIGAQSPLVSLSSLKGITKYLIRSNSYLYPYNALANITIIFFFPSGIMDVFLKFTDRSDHTSKHAKIHLIMETWLRSNFPNINVSSAFCSLRIVSLRDHFSPYFTLSIFVLCSIPLSVSATIAYKREEKADRPVLAHVYR